MGFRNPFRIQVDENDVAYVSDYSPDAQTPQQFRGPAGTGRFEIVRKPANYGWPLCYKSDLAVLQVELQHLDAAADAAAPEPYRLRQPDAAAAERLALEPRGRPGGRARPRDGPPVTDPDIWYSYHDNHAAEPARHAVLRLLRADAPADRARARPPSARGCSRSCTRAASARTAPRSTTTTRPTRTRRSSRPTTTSR